MSALQRFKFLLDVHELRPWPQSTPEVPLAIAWQRGKKKGYLETAAPHRSSKRYAVYRCNENLHVEATLKERDRSQQHKNVYEKKFLHLAVLDAAAIEDESGQIKCYGTVVINLADFADPTRGPKKLAFRIQLTQRTILKQLKAVGKSDPALIITVGSTPLTDIERRTSLDSLSSRGSRMSNDYRVFFDSVPAMSGSVAGTRSSVHGTGAPRNGPMSMRAVLSGNSRNERSAEQVHPSRNLSASRTMSAAREEHRQDVRYDSDGFEIDDDEDDLEPRYAPQPTPMAGDARSSQLHQSVAAGTSSQKLDRAPSRGSAANAAAAHGFAGYSSGPLHKEAKQGSSRPLTPAALSSLRQQTSPTQAAQEASASARPAAIAHVHTMSGSRDKAGFIQGWLETASSTDHTSATGAAPAGKPKSHAPSERLPDAGSALQQAPDDDPLPSMAKSLRTVEISNHFDRLTTSTLDLAATLSAVPPGEAAQRDELAAALQSTTPVGADLRAVLESRRFNDEQSGASGASDLRDDSPGSKDKALSPVSGATTNPMFRENDDDEDGAANDADGARRLDRCSTKNNSKEYSPKLTIGRNGNGQLVVTDTTTQSAFAPYSEVSVAHTRQFADLDDENTQWTLNDPMNRSRSVFSGGQYSQGRQSSVYIPPPRDAPTASPSTRDFPSMPSARMQDSATHCEDDRAAPQGQGSNEAAARSHSDRTAAGVSTRSPNVATADLELELLLMGIVDTCLTLPRAQEPGRNRSRSQLTHTPARRLFRTLVSLEPPVAKRLLPSVKVALRKHAVELWNDDVSQAFSWWSNLQILRLYLQEIVEGKVPQLRDWSWLARDLEPELLTMSGAISDSIVDMLWEDTMMPVLERVSGTRRAGESSTPEEVMTRWASALDIASDRLTTALRRVEGFTPQLLPRLQTALLRRVDFAIFQNVIADVSPGRRGESAFSGRGWLLPPHLIPYSGAGARRITFQTGMQLKMALMQIMHWAHDRDLRDGTKSDQETGGLYPLLRATADALMMKKDLLKDDDLRMSVCGALPPRTLLTIMQAFVPDEFSATAVDPSTLEHLRNLAAESNGDALQVPAVSCPHLEEVVSFAALQASNMRARRRQRNMCTTLLDLHVSPESDDDIDDLEARCKDPGARFRMVRDAWGPPA